ncbi:MAG: hypothetical protein P8J51_03275 [Dehalococcoidia bacterium]|nr:hypothetical protein [Dehalococcoidia bacterium]
MLKINFSTSILIAAFASFLFSIGLWFLGDDLKLEGIFVGIWVPSIISFGILMEVRK